MAFQANPVLLFVDVLVDPLEPGLRKSPLATGIAAYHCHQQINTRIGLGTVRRKLPGPGLSSLNCHFFATGNSSQPIPYQPLTMSSIPYFCHPSRY